VSVLDTRPPTAPTAPGTGTTPRLPWAVPAAIALAWAAALAVHATGLHHQLHPAHAEHAGHAGHTGHALAGPALIGLYLGAWVVMVAAMMLPSAVPMLRVFHAAALGQPRPGRVLGAFILGYLAIWTAFGALALVLDEAVHALTAPAPAWTLVAGALALAGVFQFTPLKDACLSACRHPGAWLLRHYRRGPGRAWALGWDHGRFCIGCCWALMLVMVVAGIADLRWMAALAGLMAYEKIGRHGERVAALAGVVLVALAIAVAVDQLV
jgi:predicted metal-binding membrane protein